MENLIIILSMLLNIALIIVLCVVFNQNNKIKKERKKWSEYNKNIIETSENKIKDFKNISFEREFNE
jgi:energy-converting hydrogenase Eha subunit H